MLLSLRCLMLACAMGPMVACSFGTQRAVGLVPQVGSKEGGETAPPGTWHPVIQGETLWRIAHHYGVTVNDLIKTNAIADPTTLKEGRRLFIPLAPGSDFDQRQTKIASRPTVIESPEGPDLPPEGGFIFPVAEGRVLQTFGRHGDVLNDGINIAVADGAPVRAAAPGKVVFAAKDAGWGELIIVAHTNEWVSIYAHNKERLAREGQTVARGDVIAHAGSSGRVERPQLHFELRRGVTPRNPALYLPPRKDLPRR